MHNTTKMPKLMTVVINDLKVHIIKYYCSIITYYYLSLRVVLLDSVVHDNEWHHLTELQTVTDHHLYPQGMVPVLKYPKIKIIIEIKLISDNISTCTACTCNIMIAALTCSDLHANINKSLLVFLHFCFYTKSCGTQQVINLK